MFYFNGIDRIDEKCIENLSTIFESVFKFLSIPSKCIMVCSALFNSLQRNDECLS